MDELFESLTLVQTGKLQEFPIIIFGKEYHEKLMAYVNDLKEAGTISPDDLKYIHYTDDMDEVVAICKSVIDKHNLTYERKKYFKVLGENRNR